MIECILGVFPVIEKFIDFVYVFSSFGEVERPEVLKEASIGRSWVACWVHCRY